MARVPQYARTEQLKPLSGARQQAFDNGAGQISEGVTALGSGMGQLAQGLEVRNQKIDEAYVSHFDATFAQKVRPIERGYLSSKGGNAVASSEDASKAWNEAYEEALGWAQTPRQKAMLANALNQRRQRWQNQFDSHILSQTDVWHTETQKARVAQKSVEVADLPIGSIEREAAEIELAEMIGFDVRRRGLGAETAVQEMQVAMTGIHEATINGLLAVGDVPTAVDYLRERGNEILPDKRAALTAKVEEQSIEFDVEQLMNGFPDMDDGEFEVSETNEDGTVSTKVETFMPPLSGQPRISSPYGQRIAPKEGASTNHPAVDYAVPVGTPIRAPLSGVARIKRQDSGAGLYVEIDHGGGLMTRYFHLDSTVNIRDGQRVDQGTVFALSGNSGNSTGPHLHFEVIRNGQKVNPSTLRGDVQVGGGGGGGSSRSGMPRLMTDEDAARWAASQTTDWRRRRRLEERARDRVSQTYRDRTRREDEAWRAVQQYLPDGENPVSDFDQIPQEIRDQLSPTQRNDVRGAIRASSEKDAPIDAFAAAQIEQSFRDMAAGAQAQRDQFLQTNFWSFSGSLSVSQMASLSALQRTLRGDTGIQGADQILDGQQDMVKAYARAAGITTGEKATPDDIRRLNLFQRNLQERLIALQQNVGRPLTDAEKRSVMVIASRAVEIQVTENGETSWRRGYGYEVEGAVRVREQIPRAVYDEIVRGLREAGQEVSVTNINRVYYRGLAEQRWTSYTRN